MAANPFVPNLLWFSSILLLLILFVVFVYTGVWMRKKN
jgi:hypothetical protein